MRVAGDGMLRVRSRVVCLIVLATIAHSYARPVQYLPEIPGYIPVYIRYGDQPLDEVHPGLREAFRETSEEKSVRRVRFDHVDEERQHPETGSQQLLFYKPESHVKTEDDDRKRSSEQTSTITSKISSTKNDVSSSPLPRVKLVRTENLRLDTPILPESDQRVFEIHDEQISHNAIGSSNGDSITN